jgi:protein with PEP-CTERM/exosortase system signal
MKTNIFAKNLQSVRPRLLRAHLTILGLAVVAALAASSAKANTMNLAAASPVYTITLTELSSTNLTATYDGPGAIFSSPATNNGPDNWTVTFSLTLDSSFSLNPFVKDWIEPENPLEVNEVSHGITFGDSNNLYVTSDESLLEYMGGIGVTVPNGTPLLVGTDNGLLVFLKFDDQAANPETGTGVPDTGSTLALFGFSIAGFVALTRFRRMQSA